MLSLYGSRFKERRSTDKEKKAQAFLSSFDGRESWAQYTTITHMLSLFLSWSRLEEKRCIPPIEQQVEGKKYTINS